MMNKVEPRNQFLQKRKKKLENLEIKTRVKRRKWKIYVLDEPANRALGAPRRIAASEKLDHVDPRNGSVLASTSKSAIAYFRHSEFRSSQSRSINSTAFAPRIERSCLHTATVSDVTKKRSTVPLFNMARIVGMKLFIFVVALLNSSHPT